MTTAGSSKHGFFDYFDDQLQIGGLIGFILLIVVFQMMIAKSNDYVDASNKRRLQHAITGHALVQISYMLPYKICIAALCIGCIGFLIARTYFPIWFYTTFHSLLRSEEKSGKVLPGAFYFLIGTTISALLTTEDKLYIARYAVECLAVADPIASYVGSKISSPQLCQGSTLSGCVACFITSLCVGYVMLLGCSWSVLILGAVACTISEAIPFGNDNLNIPIATTVTVLLATKG